VDLNSHHLGSTDTCFKHSICISVQTWESAEKIKREGATFLRAFFGNALKVRDLEAYPPVTGGKGVWGRSTQRLNIYQFYDKNNAF